MLTPGLLADQLQLGGGVPSSWTAWSKTFDLELQPDTQGKPTPCSVRVPLLSVLLRSRL